MCESPMGSPCPSDMYDGNLSLYEIDPHEVAAVARDAVGRLKTAFLFHVRRDAAASAALLAGLLAAPAPSAPSAPRDVDADLDRAVLRIACDMLDDVPAGDPRSVPAGAGGGAQWRARSTWSRAAGGSSAAGPPPTSAWAARRRCSSRPSCGTSSAPSHCSVTSCAAWACGSDWGSSPLVHTLHTTHNYCVSRRPLVHRIVVCSIQSRAVSSVQRMHWASWPTC